MIQKSKLKIYFTTFALFLFLISIDAFAQQNNKPNVIVIYTDDQGAVDMGSYGSKDIYTPNMDKISREGTRFTQAYVAAPVCAPSRAALLTGKYPQGAGVPGNTSHKPDSHGMPSNQYTLAELFKDNGYSTGHLGKWHLGMSKETGPNAQGFDYSFGHLRGCIDNYKIWAQNDYAPAKMQTEVLGFIDANKDQPFFMYYASPLPHLPLQVPQEYVDKYVKLFGDEKPYNGKKGYFPNRYPNAAYAGMISYLDDQVGEIVTKLKELGIYENTLIIFTSDNGPTYLGGVDAAYFNSARPFKNDYGRTKGFTHEGGIRVPMIASWPEKIKAGSKTDHISAFWDVMPTLGALVNSEVPGDIDGISFLPVLLGEENDQQEQHEFLYWEFPAYQGQQAVRMGNWKGIRKNIFKGNMTLELYDLSSDLTESIDVASENPEIVARIESIMKNEHTTAEIERFKIKELGDL